MAIPPTTVAQRLPPLPNLIFASRWLQLPLYLGLILAQAVYVFHFWVELTHLIEAAFGNADALTKLVTSIGYKSAAVPSSLNETIIMLVVLALIDVGPVVIEAAARSALAVVVLTVLALAAGHLLGGPDAATRTSIAISSALRNPGLALLVATLNHAAPAVTRTVLAYLVIAALTIVPYAL